MADKTKTTKELKLVAQFADGDDRTLSIPAPKSTLTKADINSASFIAAAEAVLVGDKAGAKFTKWKGAKVYENSITYLDLKSNN